MTKKITGPVIIFTFLFSNLLSQGLIIDHNCLDTSLIQMNWIDSAQANQRWHYAHTSHGGQLTTGLNRIEANDNAYEYARTSGSLPNVPGALCIFDGQEGDSYVTPEEYWRTASGMNKTRDVLSNNPTINVSQWSWCTQVNYYSQNDLQNYLDSISVLEVEFPGVTFVYMTGNAQTGPDNHYNQNLTQGYNRYLRNEQIRDHCIYNNKVLYDFADIDCWWYNPTLEEWELSTYEYWNGTDTVIVPFEHPQYNINQAAHTSFENCENKGKAVWWMMAKLAGWNSSININLKVFLEGPYNGTNMNTNLNEQSIIPLSQPYNTSPWNYGGTESVISIPNPEIVDWLLVEIRDAMDAASATPASTIARQAAFLLDNGLIVDMDGNSMLRFDLNNSQNLFAVVYHRNHLGVISASPLFQSGEDYILDFTTGANQAYGGTLAQVQLSSSPTIWGMMAGDGDGDGEVLISDKLNVWNLQTGTKGYLESDFNLNGQSENRDKSDLWLPNKGKGTAIPE